MKSTYLYLNSEKGFALITAIMMLFAATVMGLMVMNSSEIELLLSGAQHRYESNFNTVEGASSFEAAAVGRVAVITKTIDGTTTTRSYTVADPTAPSTLSPTDATSDVFNPYGSSTVSYGAPAAWPMDNLLQPATLADVDSQFNYHYRVSFEGAGSSIPKGYSAEKFTNYQFQVSASRTTTIEMGGNKIGPKITL